MPADPAEQLACSDAHFNDTELFEAKLPIFAGHEVEAPALPYVGRAVAAALAEADGDVYVSSSLLVDGRPVTGVGTIAAACQKSYIIAPRAAQFVISGAIADHKDVRWGVNHSPILIELNAGELHVSDFVVTHVDGSGEKWIVEVPRTTWR